MIRLACAFSLLVLGSCSNVLSPSTEDKHRAYQEHKDSWRVPQDDPLHHGLSRSVMIARKGSFSTQPIGPSP